MNDDWEDQLRSLPVPEPNADQRDRALAAADAALHERPVETPDAPTWVFPWRFATAALAALALAAFLFLRPMPSGSIPSASAAGDARLLAEMETLFPGQVNAVIARDHQVDLNLADEAARHSDQVILIEFTGHGETLRVLGYSGRPVSIPLRTRSLSFEPLTTAAGGILLIGDDFLWDGSRPSEPDGYRITARPLPPSA
jgi:hypothetical protein